MPALRASLMRLACVASYAARSDDGLAVVWNLSLPCCLSGENEVAGTKKSWVQALFSYILNIVLGKIMYLCTTNTYIYIHINTHPHLYTSSRLLLNKLYWLLLTGKKQLKKGRVYSGLQFKAE